MNTTVPLSNSTNPLQVTSDWEKVLVTTGLIILSIITIFGNTLVVVSFYTHRPLRTLTNYFIVSLSVSDILVAIISMPVWITFVMLNMDFTIFDGKLLKAWTCFDIMTGVASIMNLTAVSVDRYLHISKPMTYPKVITKTRVLTAIVIIWLFACGISLVKGLHWQWEKPNYEMLIVSFGFVLPLAVITFCYIHIYLIVKLQLRKCTFTLQKANIKPDMKAIKTIAIVILAFFICWCPFFILNAVHGWCNCSINQHAITFAKWLHYTNSTVNPIIYACFNKDYRRGFRNALIKRISRHNSTFGSLVKRSSYKDAPTVETRSLFKKKMRTVKKNDISSWIPEEVQSVIISDSNGNKVIQLHLHSSADDLETSFGEKV